MIQEIRFAHVSVVKIMAVGLPVLFISGLVARNAPHPTPVNQVFRSRQVEVVWAGSDSFRADGVKIDVRISEGGEYIELQSKDWINAPDLFVYWSPEAAAEGIIPERARLLGAFLPRRGEIYRLAQDERGIGQVWIYSLAHQRVLGSFTTGNKISQHAPRHKMLFN
jgi:hypothetical protein